VGEPNWGKILDPRVRDQVRYIWKEFQKAGAARKVGEDGDGGIDIGVVPSGDGIGYMYAEGQVLVSEKHLKRVQDVLSQPKVKVPDARDEDAGDAPAEGEDAGDAPVKGEDAGDAPAEDEDAGGTPAKGEDAGHSPVKPVVPGLVVLNFTQLPDVPERLTVPDALDMIDKALGTGIATPNHVITVAGDVGPCPATEPEMVSDQIEPYPTVCPGDAGTGISIYIADTGLLWYDHDSPAVPDPTAHPPEVVTNSGHVHPWLKGVRGTLDRLQSVSGTNVIKPYEGHGTFVAGVARCMAPGADIFVANAFKVAGSTLETHLARHLDDALADGYDLFHLSITAPTRKDLPLKSFEHWRRRLRQYKGVACVVAAGNSGVRVPTWPANFPEMVAVGALAADWRSRALFSNYGPWVDVYAPGRDLVNAFATGSYTCYVHPYGPHYGQPGQHRQFYGMAKWSGTSFSTPIVTGLIAARMSRTGENAQEAAAALLAEAREHAIPGVGPILLPRCHGHDGPRHPEECCCRGHRHDGCEGRHRHDCC
jgi:Subtilase family